MCIRDSTISPTYSVCQEHGYISGEHFTCPKCGKKAEVYSRITGYYRPVQNWNDGKAQEYKNRTLYDICLLYTSEQTAVGDKYVAENMMENNYSIGGEQSGHIIFSRYSATGDGILTSLMIMEACVDQKATLCDLAKEMKVYPQLLRNVRVSDKKTALENEKVKAAIEAAAEALGDDGRILVRESGTEPLIRVMVEAGTDDLCHKYVDSVVDVMEAEGLVVE